MTTRKPEAERFWNKVDFIVESGCWEFNSIGSHGYGVFTLAPTVVGRNGRAVYAHRWSYETLVGPIPKDLVVDHLCHNRRCVNPAHLELVTSGTNSGRRRSGSSPISEKRRAYQSVWVAAKRQKESVQ